jgi:hypothetical protein
MRRYVDAGHGRGIEMLTISETKTRVVHRNWLDVRADEDIYMDTEWDGDHYQIVFSDTTDDGNNHSSFRIHIPRKVAIQIAEEIYYQETGSCPAELHKGELR